MSVDYDLVVIGSSYEGIYAANLANQLKARTALVTQCETQYLRQFNPIINQSWGEIIRFNEQLQNNSWGIKQESIVSKIAIQEIISWENLLTQKLQTEHSLDRLSALGVDVIFGQGEFCRLPQEAFIVNQRKLRSRKFLLATGAKSTINSTIKFNKTNCFTFDDLWQNNYLASLPNEIAIIGVNYHSVQLAQGLAKFNKKIILITSDSRILPEEDWEASKLIQAQLTADGVTIFTNSLLTQIKEFDNKKWLQAGDHALETEAIIFSDSWQPNVAKLNLEGVGVKIKERGIIVNRKLQTTNKNIYACGDVLGNIISSSLAIYQANVALKNILLLPYLNKPFRYFPRMLGTYPNLATVGITNIKTKKHHGRDIYTIKEQFTTISQPHILGNINGWCKFIIRSDGKILGCTIIGDRASELIVIVAMMMQYQIKLNQNSLLGLLQTEIPVVSPSLSDILTRVTMAFHQQKLQRNKKLLSLLEGWFNLRRNWHQ